MGKLDARLPALASEQRVARVERRLAALEAAVKTGDAKVDAKLQEEALAREAAVQKVDGLLRKLTIGGLRIEAVGLTWLASGFVVATWPECVLWLRNPIPLPAP